MSESKFRVDKKELEKLKIDSESLFSIAVSVSRLKKPLTIIYDDSEKLKLFYDVAIKYSHVPVKHLEFENDFQFDVDRDLSFIDYIFSSIIHLFNRLTKKSKKELNRQ